jgi:hypothetical protein
LRSMVVMPMMWSAAGPDASGRPQPREYERKTDRQTVHVCDEDLLDSRRPVPLFTCGGLEGELTECPLRTVDHYRPISTVTLLTRIGVVLSRSPFPMSTTRLLQLRDSDGPPPLEVPRKNTDIGWDILLDVLLLLAESMRALNSGRNSVPTAGAKGALPRLDNANWRKLRGIWRRRIMQ